MPIYLAQLPVFLLKTFHIAGPNGGTNGRLYKHQNVPLPPIPGGKDFIYQPPSVVSSSNSTTENKYETIGKTLEPYKIEAAASSKSSLQGGDKKAKRLPSYSSSSASTSSSAQGGDYGFSSASPMSVATVAGLSQSPASDREEKEHKVSSHYAQISPLRGQGLPHPALMGMQSSNASHINGVTSYFQVISFIKIQKIALKK